MPTLHPNANFKCLPVFKLSVNNGKQVDREAKEEEEGEKNWDSTSIHTNLPT